MPSPSRRFLYLIRLANPRETSIPFSLRPATICGNWSCWREIHTTWRPPTRIRRRRRRLRSSRGGGPDNVTVIIADVVDDKIIFLHENNTPLEGALSLEAENELEAAGLSS